MEERKNVKLRYRAEHRLLAEGGFSQHCTAPATNLSLPLIAQAL